MTKAGWTQFARSAGWALGLGACGTSATEEVGALTRGEHDASHGPPALEGGNRAGDAAVATETSEACGRAEVTANRVIPTVWLFIDGSGSMAAAMDGSAGGASRWTSLREALLDDATGLVSRLEGSIAFGLFAYDGGLSLPGIKTPACPRVVRVDPAIDNLSAIAASYPAAPMGASTPTHYALEALREEVQRQGAKGPTYVLLATDGKPNFCDFHDGVPESQLTEQEAVATVGALATQGIKTFAISMAEGDAVLTAHLNDVAKAGATGQPVFTPNTRDALVAALASVFTTTTTCDVKLEGTIVPGSECRGDVRMNGTLLTCDAPDGYRVREDRQTLELLGGACQTLQRDAKARLEASFPCSDVVLL